jgi:2-oxoglutarate ferredoxin oxidoreductase subunit delta
LIRIIISGLIVRGRGSELLTRIENNDFTAELVINQDWCKGCGICVAFCPRKALFLNAAGKVEKVSDNCTACGVCELFCPDFALSVVKRRFSVYAGSEAGFNAGQ